jgi:hypothetical protein
VFAQLPKWCRRFAFNVVILFTVSVPILTLWNLTVGRLRPALSVEVGKPLDAVPEPETPSFAWPQFMVHLYQKEAAKRAVFFVPGRPWLVRLTNQILYSVFRTSPDSRIMLGKENYLVETKYVTEYCHRSMAELVPLMRERATLLKELQDYFTGLNKPFVYMITPSKVARVPEPLLDRVNCPSRLRDRHSFIPAYVNLLKKTGVNVVDAASLTTELRSTGLTIFPKGGTHWTQLTAAYATNALIRAINAAAARSLLPTLTWSVILRGVPVYEDQDIAQQLNLLPGPWPEGGAQVAFSSVGGCGSGKVRLSLVGGSFLVQISRALTGTGCVEGRYFFYLDQMLLLFPPVWKARIAAPSADQIRTLLDGDVIVLEENEMLAARSRLVRNFYDMLLGSRQQREATESQ